jgi:mRNA-decapping enzyme subunit 2
LDANAQESGSQTSSGDNGDPQTPSPLYTEPVVTHVDVAQATESNALGPTHVDPHFARLLSALTLSAKANRPGDRTFDVLPTAKSAILPPSAVGDPSTLHGSPQTRTALTSSVVAGDRATSPSKLSKESATVVLSNDASYLRHASPGPYVPAPPPGGLSITTSGSSTLQSPTAKSPTHSRRSSMITADLSPYLARPAGIPMNGKRLRQLALLEAVADESSRMISAPSMNPATKPQPPPREVSPVLHHAPLPPNTVMPHNSTNLSPMYSNTHGSYSSPVSQTGHINPPPPDNAFTVRPRTSNSFRSVPNHPPRSFNTRASMNQAQLLGALSGTPYPSPPGDHRLSISPMPNSNLHGPTTHSVPPIRPLASGMPTLRSVPHLHATGRGPPPPLRTPLPRAISGPPSAQGLLPNRTGSSNFGLSHPRAAQNSQLLSILNRGPGQ